MRKGAPWRVVPTNFLPWPAVYQPMRRWRAAGCCAALVHDLRLLVRLGAGRTSPPPAVSFDARGGPSTVASGARAGDSG